MNIPPFHLAIAVRDIEEAREFYGNKMGLTEGRSSDDWIDFNLFGHQFVTHLDPSLGKTGKVKNAISGVDGRGVPIPHFGVVLTMDDLKTLASKVETFIDSFIIKPYIRFKDQPGEQATLFFSDPSGNALEFKGFADIEKSLFAS